MNQTKSPVEVVCTKEDPWYPTKGQGQHVTHPDKVLIWTDYGEGVAITGKRLFYECPNCGIYSMVVTPS